MLFFQSEFVTRKFYFYLIFSVSNSEIFLFLLFQVSYSETVFFNFFI